LPYQALAGSSLWQPNKGKSAPPHLTTAYSSKLP